MKKRIVTVLLILVCSALLVSNVLATPTCPNGGSVCQYEHRADGLYVTISQSGTTTVWNERDRNISSHGQTIPPNGSIDFRAILIDQECSAMNNRIGMRYIPEETGVVSFFAFDIQSMCAYFNVPWGNSSNIQSVPQTNQGSTDPLLDCQMVTDGANIRNGPGMNYDVIGWVTTGTVAMALSIDSGWYHINYGGRQQGYVSNTVAKVNGCSKLKDTTEKEETVMEAGGIKMTPYGGLCLMELPQDGTVTINVPNGKIVYETINRSVSLATAEIPSDGESYNAVWPGTNVQGIIWNDCSISSFLSPRPTPVPTQVLSAVAVVSLPETTIQLEPVTEGCKITLPEEGRYSLIGQNVTVIDDRTIDKSFIITFTNIGSIGAVVEMRWLDSRGTGHRYTGVVVITSGNGCSGQFNQQPY